MVRDEIRLEPMAEAHRASAVLGAVTVVAAVERIGSRDGDVTLLVRPRDGRFIADLVAGTLAANKLSAGELNTKLIRLDDVFPPEYIREYAEFRALAAADGVRL